MKITLILDDDLADDYQHEAAERTLSLAEVLADRLARAPGLDPRSRYIILEGRTRERLEAILGGLPLSDAETLLQRTSRLARVHFGDHTLALTPGQMEEIAHMAGKQGKSVEAVVQAAWAKFCEDFFVLLPTRVK